MLPYQDVGTLLDSGQFEEAIAAAEVTLQENPAQPLPWLAMARARQALGQFEEAAAAFGRVDALWPGRGTILMSQANCLAEADRLVEAEACLRRALAAAPNTLAPADLAAAHTNLGAVLARLEHQEEACLHLRTALAIAPDLREAHRNLAALLEGTDRTTSLRHRDAAYRGHAVLIREAARARRRVLVISSADSGNIPLRYLLPRDANTIVEWIAEYAEATDTPPACDIAFNAMGDPDMAPSLPTPVRDWLASNDMRLLNAPEAVSRTRRDLLPALLDGIEGAVLPKVLRHHATDGPAVAAVARVGLSYPILARPFGSHGGEGVRRVAAADELAEEDAYLTEFVDYADPDGWFRKYRVIFVAGAPYPYHLAISRHWMVHYWTAGMSEDAARRAEERHFLTDPEAVLGPIATRALEAIGRRLALDYGGIDFSVLPDGRLVVFEANAPMLVHPERETMFLYRNTSVERIRSAFARLLDGATQATRPATLLSV